MAATPGRAADDLIVVDADAYTRQRRDNLIRMHWILRTPDDEADEITLATARRLRTLWHMNDLFPHVPLPQGRVFRACYRLVARGSVLADLDNVLWEHSKLDLAG